MAQILKEDKKEEIIEAAKDEFLKHGFENTNMRAIAFKSRMTVGNLYRYFKNKEELNRTIVGPTIKQINDLLGSLSDNEIGFENTSVQAYSVERLREMLDQLSDGIVDVYLLHKKEFNILMMHSELNDRITSWFTDILKQVIQKTYGVKENEEEIRILARAYAVSLFSGFRELMATASGNEKIKSLVMIYFRSYIYMLEQDLNKYLQ